MGCGVIKPKAKHSISKINRVTDKPILIVNAFTVLLDFPSSLTKNMMPLANEPRIINMTIIVTTLINICYTPHLNLDLIMNTYKHEIFF